VLFSGAMAQVAAPTLAHGSRSNGDWGPRMADAVESTKVRDG
jgi:hypothetical protein